MRKLLLIIVLLLVISLVGLGAYWWTTNSFPKKISHENEAADLAKTEQLIKENKSKEAIDIIINYRDVLNINTPNSAKWVNLLIQASEQTKDFALLLGLYETHPEAFNNKEGAVILAADAMIMKGNSKGFEELRAKWKGKESKELANKWFILDADKMILDNKRKEALIFLEGKNFEGKDDVNRLTRLAILSLTDNPQKSWNYLNEALKKDPTNGPIRIYRARMLEAVNKPELAVREWVTAMQSNPDNSIYRDLLAEFFLRQNNYPVALAVWVESLRPPTSDVIWLKTLFWSKIVLPVTVNWKELTVPEGNLKDLVEYLISLQPGEFWNAANYEKVPDGAKLLNTQQSTYWLRLLDHFKKGEEKEAQNLLNYNPFKEASVNPQLEIALKRIMNWRSKGRTVLGSNDKALEDKFLASKTNTPIDLPEYFKALKEMDNIGEPAIAGSNPDTGQAPNTNRAKISPEILALLKSDEAYAAAFLSAGWLEAALQLNKATIVPAELPAWYAYGLTQAYRYTKGNIPAIEFASKQHPTPMLNLLLGELLIAEKSTSAALEKLQPYVKEDSDIGFRAAWLASLIYIEQQKFDQAKAVINENTKLANDNLGKETLARIALLQGDEPQAELLYTTLEKESPEAKSYLARKAFLIGDYKRAKELTEELLKLYPNNPTVRDNLKQITEKLEETNTNASNKNARVDSNKADEGGTNAVKAEETINSPLESPQTLEKENSQDKTEQPKAA